MSERRSAFAAAVRAFGGGDDDAIGRATADLETRWGDPRRGYHDLVHLDEVLERLDELDAATPAAVLAAWFHDAVYEGRPGRDEQDSAALASSSLLALGVGTTAAAGVARLVLVTADHEPAPDDGEAAALCDADLAVLATAPPRYAAYVAGVRREYAHVPQAAFAAGRAAVLGRLLDRPSIYRTAVAVRRWEAAARLNLERERDSLLEA